MPFRSGDAAPVSASHAKGELATENRRCKDVGRIDKNQVGIRLQTGVEVDVYSCIKPVDRHLARRGDCPARTYRVVEVDEADSPPGHLWRCCEAAVESRNPEADTAFIGKSNSRRISNCKSREQCGCDTAQCAEAIIAPLRGLAAPLASKLIDRETKSSPQPSAWHPRADQLGDSAGDLPAR